MKANNKKGPKTAASAQNTTKVDTIQPLEIAIDSPALTAKFNGVLEELEKFEPKLPKDILISCAGRRSRCGTSGC